MRPLAASITASHVAHSSVLLDSRQPSSTRCPLRRIGLAVVLNSRSCRMRFCLTLLLAIAAASPPIDAQQASRIPKIGFLGTSAQAVAPNIAAFRLGLRELGYI